MRRHFFNSAVIANSKMDYSQEYPLGIKLKVFCYTEPESGIRRGRGGGPGVILKVEDH